MTHYKIEKKTLCGITQYGDLREESTYRCYVKILWWWEQLKTYDMYDSGLISDHSVGFKSLESAEKFINIYHKNRHKIGRYEITTVKLIDKE